MLFVLLALVTVMTLGTYLAPKPEGEPSEPPEFSGPWAREYESLYNRADHPLVKEILSDGQITVTEYMTLGDELVACFESQGAVLGEVYTDGNVALGHPDKNADWDTVGAFTNRVHAYCSAPLYWDDVTSLYLGSRSNPYREDWYTLVAGCVVRMGVRPEGYTAGNYRFDDAFRPSETRTLEQFVGMACESDPRTELSIYEVQAECLVRSEVREVGYSAQQFREEFEAGTLPIFYEAEMGVPIPEDVYRDVVLSDNCYQDPFYANP